MNRLLLLWAGPCTSHCPLLTTETDGRSGVARAKRWVWLFVASAASSRAIAVAIDASFSANAITHPKERP